MPLGDYFGDCPKCYSEDSVLTYDGQLDTTDGSHWMVCHKHKLCWCIGANLFSAWRHMPKDLLLANEYRLMTYAEAEPVVDLRNMGDYQHLLAGTTPPEDSKDEMPF